MRKPAQSIIHSEQKAAPSPNKLPGNSTFFYLHHAFIVQLSLWEGLPSMALWTNRVHMFESVISPPCGSRTQVYHVEGSAPHSASSAFDV